MREDNFSSFLILLANHLLSSLYSPGSLYTKSLIYYNLLVSAACACSECLREESRRQILRPEYTTGSAPRTNWSRQSCASCSHCFKV